MRRVNTQDLVRTAGVTVAPGTPVADLAQLLPCHQITRVLVMEVERLVGIGTEADVGDNRKCTAAVSVYACLETETCKAGGDALYRGSWK